MAKYRKLSRTSAQRKALIRGQVTALLANGKIVTTEAKAKEIRKVAEGLIALGVTGVIQPTMSALLHNTSTLLIGMDSMKSVL